MKFCTFFFKIRNIGNHALIISILFIFTLSINFTTAQNKALVDSLLAKISKIKEDSSKTGIYINIGMQYDYADYKEAVKYYTIAFETAKRNNQQKYKAKALLYIGETHVNNGNYALATEFYNKALNAYQTINDPKGISESYKGIGNINCYKGTYPEAIKNYQKALRIVEKIGDKKGISSCLNNIGIIYEYQQQYKNALDYYFKSLRIKEQISKEHPKEKYLHQGISNTWTNIGNIYSNIKNYDEALKCHQKAYEIRDSINNKQDMAYSLANIGQVHALQKKYDLAIIYYNKALKSFYELNNKMGIAYNNNLLGEAYYKIGDFKKALVYLQKSLQYATETNTKEVLLKNYQIQSDCYVKLNDYKKAYEAHVGYFNYRDSIYNEKNTQQLHEMEGKYENEKKQQQINLQKAVIGKKDAQAKQQKIYRNALIIGAIFLILFIFVIYGSYKRKKNDNILLSEQNEEIKQQNEEISVQKEEIEKQKEIIEEKNNLVMDSIYYAKNIQSVILPSKERIEKLLPEHFIFYVPKDVVSGDFYWMTQKGNQIIIAAADCTGHGVPGALMSMLGTSFLNDIIIKDNIIQPDAILNRLRTDIIESLQQKGEYSDQKDGMDIALCMLNKDTLELQFAGANNPCWIIRNFETNNSVTGFKTLVGLEEIKPDRMPVSYYARMDAYTINSIQLNPKDSFYIFSDGFASQFGGKFGKKIQSKKMKEILYGIRKYSMSEQKELLNAAFNHWKGSYEQIDDILVIGVRV